MDVLQYRSHDAAQFKCNALFRNDNRRDRDQCDQIWQNFTSLKKILEFICICGNVTHALDDFWAIW